MSPEMKRYSWRVGAAMAVYCLTLVGVNRWFAADPPAGALAYIVAALPALAIIAVFWAIARLIVELNDEYIRMLIVRQSLIATGFAMAVATVWGFLESFRLVPHAMGYWAAVLWFAGFGIGAVVNAALERSAAK